MSPGPDDPRSLRSVLAARVRQEDWAGAHAAIDGRYRLPRLMILSPMGHGFLRSRICSRLGRDQEARVHYGRGFMTWEDGTRVDPAAWERSDAMRWKREAEAALER